MLIEGYLPQREQRECKLRSLHSETTLTQRHTDSLLCFYSRDRQIHCKKWASHAKLCAYKQQVKNRSDVFSRLVGDFSTQKKKKKSSNCFWSNKCWEYFILLIEQMIPVSCERTNINEVQASHKNKNRMTNIQLNSKTICSMFKLIKCIYLFFCFVFCKY